MLHKYELETFPAFDGLTSTELDILRELSQRKTLPSNAIFVELDEPPHSVYFILTGTVRTYIHRPCGAEVVLGIQGPGEIIGELGVIDNQQRSASVITIEPTTLLSMDNVAFRRSLDSLPILSRNLLSTLTNRVRRLTDQVEAQSTLDLHGRIERQLLIFAHDYGQPSDDGGVMLNLNITQSDLAKLVGASRGRVNRILCYFRKYSYISISDNQRITLNQKALEQWGKNNIIE